MLTFAAPVFLWGLAALPLVVLLHRIRVRRERREVAGAFLWRRARDAGAHRPRLRPSLLLLLQLLAVTGMTLAAARPEWNVAGPALRVLVVDGAASMTARDGADSPVGRELEELPSDASRLDAARARAEELVRGGGPVAIVRGGREPRLALAPSEDRDEVRAALAGLRAGDADPDPARALRLARDVADAAGARGAELHWLSDAPPPATAGVRVHPLAGRGENVGVTGFELVAGQAWLRVSSSYRVPLELPVAIDRGDERIASATLLVPAGGDAAASFPVTDGTQSLTARIDPPRSDALALDDEAWAGGPTLVVALDREVAALERALGAIDGVQVRVASAAARLPADLRVLHGRLERAPPDGPTLLLPDRDAPAVAATILRWNASDPLLRFVDLRELRVAYVDPPPFGEEEGWTPLVHGVVERAEAAGDDPRADADGQADAETDAEAAPSVPLLQRLDRPEGPVWRLAFHPVRGDLTLRPAFPTLVVNLIDEVRGEDRVPLGATLPAGATREGRPVDAALEPGPYQVDGRTVFASLLDERATRLPGPEAFDAATASDPAPAEAEPAEARSRREVTPWLVAAALLLLLLEWWGWTGARLPRVGVPRRPRGEGASR